MKAIVVEHLGQQGTLRDLADPIPESNEVLVKIDIAGVNPVDWKIRDVYGHSMPYTLGQDFAGRVVSVGQAVRDYAYGDRVFGIARAHGAYAELTLMPVDDKQQPMAKIPESVGDGDAAGLPTPGLTALACVDRVSAEPKKRILIVGVSGSLGQIAAQLAIARGAVICGVGGAAQEHAMHELGVDEYIAYDQVGGRDLLDILDERYRHSFDAVIDAFNPMEKMPRVGTLVRDGGILASTNHSVEQRAFPGRRIIATNVNLSDTTISSHDGLRMLAKFVEQGTLRVPIADERSLSDAVQALDMVKHGHISGKMLLTVS